MKRFLLVALAALSLTLAMSALAPAIGQTVTQMRNPANNSATPDTVSGAGVTYFAARAYGPGYITVQLDLKKISGTVAGSAVLQASVDHNTTPSMWATVGTDSLTLANGDNTKIWVVPADYLHYRVRLITSGTQVNAPKVFYYQKPNQTR